MLPRARGEMREGLPLASAIATLDAPRRAALARLALVVLRPDSLAAGRGPAILDDLRTRHGAVPVALRVLGLAPALVDALYGRQEKIPRESLWLHHELFASGPAAAVLVAGPPGLTEALFAAKGPSATLAPDAGDSLRARFGRASSFHAVVHLPEDLPAFVAEATLLFPWATLTRLAPPPVATWAVRALVELGPRPGGSVFAAVLAVKRRILAALAVRDALPPGLLEPLDAAVRDLDGAPYRAQRDRMVAFARGEREALVAASGAAVRIDADGGATVQQRWRAREEALAPAALLAATWLLSGHEPADVESARRVVETLPRHDVALLPSQRTLLAAALRDDLNPAAVRDGQRVYPLEAPASP